MIHDPDEIIGGSQMWNVQRLFLCQQFRLQEQTVTCERPGDAGRHGEERGEPGVTACCQTLMPLCMLMQLIPTPSIRPPVLHPSSSILHPSSFILHPSSFILLQRSHRQQLPLIEEAAETKFFTDPGPVWVRILLDLD
ncbi:uncharacterized protein V6R79_014018 [Siganus canaliculatus]